MNFNNFISSLIFHKTAPNLLMALMIILGLFSSKMLNTQFFPDYTIDYITISVEWPGASAKDVEESVLEVIEPKIRYIDGVKRVRSNAREGLAKILMEFESGTDLQRALSDVEAGVARVVSLPEDTKRPEIKRIIPYEQIGLVLVSGNVEENILREESLNLRKSLLNNGIDKVTIEGLRSRNIYVDINPTALLANNLTLGEIGKKISKETRNIPSGTINDLESVQLRLLGEREFSEQISSIEIISGYEGVFIKLSDLGNVYEAYDRDDVGGRSSKKNALTLRISRAMGNDTLNLTKILEDTVNNAIEELPAGVSLKIYDLSSQLIRDRINLLLKNGLGGLVLVILVLSLFLRKRVVVWVAAGIPAAIAVTLAIMLFSGQSINMVSLFALIMMIGIIVDDSIVVAEHIETKYEEGLDSFKAAFIGSTRMLGPVTAASITTVAAFAPVLLISGVIGQIISAIPFVVISVIIASLFECFCVLPGHLAYSLNKLKSKKVELNKTSTFKKKFINFRQNYFTRFATICLKYRYTTIVSALSILIISFGMLSGGHVKFYFFPSPESPIILTNFSFTPGTNKETVVQFIDSLETALYDSDLSNVVEKTYSTIGRPMWGSRLSSEETGEHIGGMIVELTNPEERKIRTSEVIRKWRESIVSPAGLEKLTIQERKGGPPGLDIDIRLSSSTIDPMHLKNAALDLSKRISIYRGITDISDDLPWGKREIVLEINNRGKSLGFNTEFIAKEMRSVFEGIIAHKFYRGEDEVEIIVRNDPKFSKINTLSHIIIKSPKGEDVPLSEVVDYKTEQGFSIIRRQNGSREVAITAEIDENIANPDDIIKELINGPIKEISKTYEIDWRLAGRAEEQSDTFGDMKKGVFLALGIIYIILALIFHSYTRPFVVMAIIPFSLIGVIFGHWLTGFDITILSLVSLLGLSGIVVNDSIIMVSTINEKISNGVDIFEAVLQGATARLRAVILTSLTTIGGLTPLLFESSVQAQVLNPLDISLDFGLISTTFIVLDLVPALVLIGDDLKNISLTKTLE